MRKVFKYISTEFSDPVILRTENSYSMSSARGLLKWLEQNGATIDDDSWKGRAYVNLVEKGIEVKFERVTFTITCSYEDVLFNRISGNKTDFWALCKLFSETTN